jgi:hypothetical protein
MTLAAVPLGQADTRAVARNLVADRWVEIDMHEMIGQPLIEVIPGGPGVENVLVLGAPEVTRRVANAQVNAAEALPVGARATGPVDRVRHLVVQLTGHKARATTEIVTTETLGRPTTTEIARRGRPQRADQGSGAMAHPNVMTRAKVSTARPLRLHAKVEVEIGVNALTLLLTG